MSDEGKVELNKDFVLKWSQNDEGTLDIYVVPTDPSRSVFHGVIYPSDDGGYTKYGQDSDKAKEVVSDLIAKEVLPDKYIKEAEKAKEQKEHEQKTERIAQLENEIEQLRQDLESSEEKI